MFYDSEILNKSFEWVLGPQLKAFTCKFLEPLILTMALILSLLSLLIINNISYKAIVILHMILFIIFSMNSPIPLDVIISVYLPAFVLISIIKCDSKAIQFVSTRSAGLINWILQQYMLCFSLECCLQICLQHMNIST